MRSWILTAIVIFFFVESAEAGGAAVRKQKTNIRAQRHIRLYSEQPRPADLTPQQETPEPQPQTSPEVRTEYPPKEVLVSSPFFKNTATGPVVSKTNSTNIASNLIRIGSVFDESSEVWPRLDDMRMKAMIVASYIQRFQQEGVVIQKPPLYYAAMINGMAQNQPVLLRQPFKDILRTVAIIEYDFNNGQDKDALAASVLGPKAFAENKKRLGLP